MAPDGTVDERSPLYEAPLRIDECFRIGSHADLSAVMTCGTFSALSLSFYLSLSLWSARSALVFNDRAMRKLWVKIARRMDLY